MADGVVGALRVVLGLDSAALDKGLRSAETRINGFGKSLTKLGAGLTAGLSIGGIVASIKGAIDNAERMGEVAKSLGVPVEELSALKYAAEQSGGSFEALTKSITILSKNAIAALKQPTGQAAQWFKNVGVSADDLRKNLSTPLPLLLKIADGLKAMGGGLNENATRMGLLGRSSAELGAMLDEGSKGILTMVMRARELGIVISEKTANAADKFKDTWADLGHLFGALSLQIAEALLPHLQSLAEWMIQLSQKSDTLQSAVDGMVVTFKVLTTGVILAMTSIQAFAKVLEYVIKVGAAFGRGGFKEAWATLAAGATETKDIFANNAKLIINMWKPVPEEITVGQKRIKKSVDDTSNSLRNQADAAKKAHEANLKLIEEVRKVEESVQTPTEKYAAELEKLDDLFKRTSMSAETYARAVNKAKIEMLQTNQTLQVLEQGLTSAFDRALDGAMTFQEQLQALGRDLARLAAQAAFKALLFPSTTGGTTGLLGSLFAGFRAGGGPVSGGRAYMVGERGPEMFIPAASGQMIANKDLGGGGALTVRVISDDDKFRAFVQDESGKVVAQSAPSIIAQSTQSSVRAVRSGRRNDPSYFGR